jgi:hypothetical protein
MLGVERIATAPHTRCREFGDDLAQGRTTGDLEVNVAHGNVV